MIAFAASILSALLAALSLGLGAWSALSGVVLLATAGYGDDADASAIRVRSGVAMALVGLLLFFAGSVVAARTIGA